jgi:3-hydroxymyristoyl/3-hydroxydecanoyl-(acyl carrier protein) dehydratase
VPQTTISFPAEHPVFAGHFPGRPIVPGVLLLDHVRRSVQAAIGQQCSGVSTAKFHSPAGPGETMIVDYAVNNNFVYFEINVGSRRIADGRFSL